MKIEDKSLSRVSTNTCFIICISECQVYSISSLQEEFLSTRKTRQKADSFLESICYRSDENLVSVQSIFAHQRSMPLYTLNKCKKAKPWRILPISRSEKHSNWVNDNVLLEKIPYTNAEHVCVHWRLTMYLFWAILNTPVLWFTKSLIQFFLLQFVFPALRCNLSSLNFFKWTAQLV